jgi:hypothetical protein
VNKTANPDWRVFLFLPTYPFYVFGRLVADVASENTFRCLEKLIHTLAVAFMLQTRRSVFRGGHLLSTPVNQLVTGQILWFFTNPRFELDALNYAYPDLSEMRYFVHASAVWAIVKFSYAHILNSKISKTIRQDPSYMYHTTRLHHLFLDAGRCKDWETYFLLSLSVYFVSSCVV